jgi:hypothetical protein
MKKIISIVLTAGLILTANTIYSQTPTPAPPQKKSILLMNGVAHIGNGEVIQNSYVGFKNGKLELVADATSSKINPADWDTIIKIEGKHVYPGIIAPNSTVGLIEIDAVRSTNDLGDVGGMIPNVRSLIAYNTDSKIIPTVRTNGVLIGQITPRRNILSGTSSIMMFDGWNWEDAVLKADDGVHLNWPGMFRRNWTEGVGVRIEKSENYSKQKEEISKFFKDARAYYQVGSPEKNLRFEAMKGIFAGTQTLFIHSNYVKELIDAVNFSKEFNIPKMVIVGGKDSWMITSILKENNIPVMLNRVHDLPDRPEDDLDLPYKTPFLLHQGGVLYCLQNEGDMEGIHARNIPFLAGNSVPYGLSKELALMSITLNSAKILGIDKKVGSLEVGKDATLFISTGDALDILTNNVEWVFIQGRTVDLNNEQKMLNKMYLKKYGKE